MPHYAWVHTADGRRTATFSAAIVMSGMIAIGIVGVAIDVALRALQARIERHRTS